MNEYKEGDVVICSTTQAGTVFSIYQKTVGVILANNDIWVGPIHDLRHPQDQADLDSRPLNVERFEPKLIPVNRD
jgi:hypothetical protein